MSDIAKELDNAFGDFRKKHADEIATLKAANETLKEANEDLSARVLDLEQQGPVRETAEQLPAKEKQETWRAPNGEEIPVFRHKDGFSAYNQKAAADYFAEFGQEVPSIGALMLGMVNRKGASATVQKALAEGTDSAGGYTVPEALSGSFIDALRPRARVMQAGAGMVPLTTAANNIATVETYPTPGWRAEGDAVSVSDFTFGVRTLSPKSVSFIVKASNELLEDSPNAEQIIGQVLVNTLAEEIDRAALLGSGADNQPRGILNTSGVLTVDMATNGAAIADYSKILEALESLETADGDAATGMIMHPRSKYAIAGLVDSQGQPLRAPEAVSAVPMMASSKIPIDDTHGTADNASRIYLGNFRELMMGWRHDIKIEVLRERYAETHETAFKVYARFDVALAHAESFCMIEGVIPAS